MLLGETMSNEMEFIRDSTKFTIENAVAIVLWSLRTLFVPSQRNRRKLCLTDNDKKLIFLRWLI